jgi:hypothetical protein
VRSVVTDGTGQYRIEQLRGGSYTVTSPIVDIQSSQRQRVIDHELLVAIPTGRTSLQ